MTDRSEAVEAAVNPLIKLAVVRDTVYPIIKAGKDFRTRLTKTRQEVRRLLSETQHAINKRLEANTQLLDTNISVAKDAFHQVRIAATTKLSSQVLNGTIHANGNAAHATLKSRKRIVR